MLMNIYEVIQPCEKQNKMKSTIGFVQKLVSSMGNVLMWRHFTGRSRKEYRVNNSASYKAFFEHVVYHDLPPALTSQPAPSPTSQPAPSPTPETPTRLHHFPRPGMMFIGWFNYKVFFGGFFLLSCFFLFVFFFFFFQRTKVTNLCPQKH